MKVTLTPELETLVKEKVRSGRYVDESDLKTDFSPPPGQPMRRALAVEHVERGA